MLELSLPLVAKGLMSQGSRVGQQGHGFAGIGVRLRFLVNILLRLPYSVSGPRMDACGVASGGRKGRPRIKH